MEVGEVNAFGVWAELARGLRDRLVSELGDERPYGPYAGDIVGELAALVTRFEHLGLSLRQSAQREPKTYDAFLRALEGS